MTEPRPGPLGPAAREAVLQLWLANIAFGVFLGLGYLRHLPDSQEPRLWLFALPALVSSVVTLTLVPGLLFTLWAPFARGMQRIGWTQAVVWAFFHVLLYTDYRVFNTFRYHFSGQVWSVIFARGSEDAIYLGWSVWRTVALGLAGVGAVELFLWKRFLAGAREVEHTSRRRHFAHPIVIWCAVLLPAVFLEKTLYAQADLEQDRELTTLSELFPVYPKLPAADLASSLLGVEVPERPRIELGGIRLQYPLEHPELDPAGARPNVLLVVIDCWRSDMLSDEATPRLSAWSEDARRFANHLSGGNSTRFGLFSLLYGLHGSYWFPVVNERRSPVLIDALLDAGYELAFFSSASMDFVELRSTTCVRIPERVHDDFPSDVAWRRDRMAADACAEWLGERARDASERPFFALLMLDAPHQRYSYPPEHEVFLPSAVDVDYMVISQPDGPPPGMLESVRNRYRNAVHYADSVAADVLVRLDALGLDDDTLVIVTGDHGEEFMEQGYFGHTSTHGPPQVRVPLVMRGPGVEPGVESRPTSHVDFPATLLELLGASPERRGTWTVGENLLEPLEERRRTVAGWNELGLWTPDGILRIPLGPGSFDLKLYDYDWKFVPRDWDVLERQQGPLERLSEECNRFLR